MVSGRAGRSRIERLEALKIQLAERDYTTAAELAGELGVSVRTMHRDLAVLRDLGTPIDADRGRGGGLRLEQGWSLGRVHLNQSEAVGLLVSLTIAEKVGSPLLLEDSRSIVRKVSAAFAPTQARRILAMRRRVLVGELASDRVLATYVAPAAGLTKPLLDAFANQRLALIRYQDQHGTLSEREIELQFLYYNVPIWYALTWDRLRDDIRSFRIDRIRDIQVLPTEFRLRRSELFLRAGEDNARTL
ncbi:MAG: helix-turn-helix transcriptional regulator [Actinomycetes bacterium]